MTTKFDPADDGPEVIVIGFLRLFPEGSPRLSEIETPMEVYRAIRQGRSVRVSIRNGDGQP